jgi:hypothetical protein
VLDLARPGTDEDDDDAGQATDRSYWVSRGPEAWAAVADRVLALVNEIVPGLVLKYDKNYMGLARNGIAGSFATFRPCRGHAIAGFRIPAAARQAH